MSSKHEEREASRRSLGMVADCENKKPSYWDENSLLSWLAAALLVLVLLMAAVLGPESDPDSYDWVMGHLSHARVSSDLVG
jgi:hypothetical protein